MTAPAPTLRAAALLAIASQVVLGIVAFRHLFVWGAGHPVLGVELYVWLNVGEALGLLVFTLLGVTALRRALAVAPNATPRALLLAGLAFAVAATAVPPFLSSDVFDYLARGRAEAHYGANPYTTPVAALPALVPLPHQPLPSTWRRSVTRARPRVCPDRFGAKDCAPNNRGDRSRSDRRAGPPRAPPRIDGKSSTYHGV